LIKYSDPTPTIPIVKFFKAELEENAGALLAFLNALILDILLKLLLSLAGIKLAKLLPMFTLLILGFRA
jgi:hypothetical protein